MRAGSSFRARVLLGIALFYVILGNVNGDLIFGQSFDNSSTTKDFSRPVWEGILTAFDEINSVYGGVRNTNLTLLAMDDQYNATISVANCLELVNNGSLALLGNVGTGQTAASNNKLLSLNKTVPIIGPVTGAYAARVPLQETFIHLGASYEDESIAMVKYAVGTLLLNRISVFYQNDAFGQAGVLALKKSLKSVNLEIFSEGNFPGTATDPELMRPGLLSLTKNGTVRPQAIVFVTVVSQVARFLDVWYKNITDPSSTAFFLLSVVDGGTLRKSLNVSNIDLPPRLYQAATNPSPRISDNTDPLVINFIQRYNITFPGKAPSSAGVKGYLVGRFLHQVLLRIDSSTPITSKAIISSVFNTSMFNIDGHLHGPYLRNDSRVSNPCNQGLKKIWLIKYNPNDDYEEVGTLTWDTSGACFADPAALRPPIIFGQSLPLNSADPFIAKKARDISLGIQAAFSHQNKLPTLQGHLLKLISKDDGGSVAQSLSKLRSMVVDDKIIGVVGLLENDNLQELITNFTSGSDAVIPIIGPASGLSSIRRIPNVLGVRQSYRDEFFSLFDYATKSVFKFGFICEKSVVFSEICDDAEVALNSAQIPLGVRIDIPLSPNADDIEAAKLHLNNLPLFDNITFNVPLQALVYIGQNTTSATQIVKVLSSSNPKMMYLFGSYMDQKALLDEVSVAGVDFSNSIGSRPFPVLNASTFGEMKSILASDYNVNITNQTDASLHLQEGFYVGKMIVAALSKTFLSKITGQEFLKSVFFSSRLSLDETFLRFGPYENITEGKLCNQGIDVLSITNLTTNEILVTSERKSCTESSVPLRSENIKEIRKKYGSSIVEDFQNAYRVNPGGVITTFTVVIVLLLEGVVCGYLAIWTSGRSKKAAERAAKAPTMSLIRHSFANYLALWAIFLDAVEFFTLIVSIPDEWLENSLAGATQVLKTLRIGPAYGWYHALGFVLISIWLLYGIIFLQPKLVSSLQTKAPYLLAPGPILLPILATVAFLPGIRILLNYVECKYTKNVAFFSYDFEQLCFNDQHMIWLIISVFLAVLYVPFIMYFCGVWQELQEELDIKYDIHMLVYQNFAKLFLSLFIVVQPREPTAYLVVHSVTYASLTVYVLRANPTKVTWAPIWKSAGFIVSFWSSIVCLIAHYQAQKNDIWPWILIAAGFFVILLSAYLIHRRKFTTRVFIPKPNAQKKDKVSKMMRLFKAKGNMGSKGSSSMNSSGSLGSANPEMNKMFQTTVPNWIVRFQLDNKIDQETAEYLLREITESNPLLAEMFFRADGNEENFYKVLFTLRGIEILRLPRPHVRRNSSSSDTRGGPAVGDVIRTGAILDNVEGATRPKESHKVPKLDELKEEGEEEESEASVPKL